MAEEIIEVITCEGNAPVSFGDLVGEVSDSAKLQAEFDAKENSFTKNTAFNKNFGTTAGTVAEGNHTHGTITVGNVLDVAKSGATYTRVEDAISASVAGK